MQGLFGIYLLVFLILPVDLVRAESLIQNHGYSGREISVDGYILDTPKFWSGNGGQSQRYTFLLGPKPKKAFGDEYIMVTFHTQKWGRTVGSLKARPGDHISLKGIYLESKTKGKANLSGSIQVNNFSYKSVMGK